MHSQLQGRFKLPGGLVGEPFSSTNGILQGCPISVILLNIYIQTWLNLIGDQVPEAKSQSNADDLLLTAQTVEVLDHAIKVTELYAQDTGMLLSPKKSCIWATLPHLREELWRLQIAGQCIPAVADCRYLGAFLGFDLAKHKSRLSHHLEACKRICSRIQMTKLPMQLRELLVASLATPRALHACCASAGSCKAQRSLRAAIARTIWGQANTWRANEILFTMLSRGHLVDPPQIEAFQCMTTLKRVLTNMPDLVPVYQRVFNMRQAAQDEGRRQSANGPIAVLRRACSTANVSVDVDNPLQLWMLKEGDRLEVQAVSLLESDKQKFAHQVRTSLRMEQWDELRYRGPRFLGGEETGFDANLSTHLYRSNKLRGLDKYRLRCIMSGAVATQERLAKKWPNSETPWCKCCDGRTVETVEHLFLECPAHHRARTADLLPQYFQALPPCAKLHGILPANWPIPHDMGTGRDAQLDLAYRLQYTLIGILESRESIAPSNYIPRWQAQRSHKRARRAEN